MPRRSAPPMPSGGPCQSRGLSVDQQAALVGQHCLEPGESKCTFGTGAFLLANAGPQPTVSSTGLAVSVAWQLGDAAAYCVDGQVYAAGAAIAWLQRWGFLRRPEELDAIASSVADSGGVRVVPALTGLGAPWWEPDALASIDGIGPGTEPAHVVRSTVEGLAAQVTLLARAAAVDLGRPLALLRVDGGLTRSRVLMQMQADLLQVPVEVASSPHATAAGVGALARLGAGTGRTLNDVVRRDRPDARFEPVMGGDEAGERLARLRARRGSSHPDRFPRDAVTDDRRYDVAVIGAGVVGTAIGRQLARYRLRTVLIERANDVGTGTSKANTAIVHTGFDTQPGSLESSLVRRGHELLTSYAVGERDRARGDGGHPGGLDRGAGGTARRRAGQGSGQRLRTRGPDGPRRARPSRAPPGPRGDRGRHHSRRIDHLSVEHQHRLRHRSGRRRRRTPSRRGCRRRGARRVRSGCCRPPRGRSGPIGWSTRRGSVPTSSTGASATTSSPSRPAGPAHRVRQAGPRARVLHCPAGPHRADEGRPGGADGLRQRAPGPDGRGHRRPR